MKLFACILLTSLKAFSVRTNSLVDRPADYILQECDDHVHPHLEIPKQDANSTMRLDIEFYPTRFFRLNDIDESFSIGGQLEISWNASCIRETMSRAWYPKNKIIIAPDPAAFWLPTPITHMNALANPAIDSDSFQASLYILQTPMPSLLNVFYFGSLGTFHSACAMHPYKFPFDSQTCDIRILIHRGNHFLKNGRLVLIPPPPDSANWQLTGSNTSLEFGNLWQYEAIFEFTFSRKPQYFLLTLYYPGLILCFLELASFLLPAEGSDRTIFLGTVILAFFMLQNQIAANLPKVSEYTLAGHYALGQTLGALLCTVYAAAMCAYIDAFPQQAKGKLRPFGKAMSSYVIIDKIVFVATAVSILLFNLSFATKFGLLD